MEAPDFERTERWQKQRGTRRNLWLDARYEHVHEDGHMRSLAVVVAYGVWADEVGEVLGLHVGLREHVALWRAFLQSLVGRGVSGVQLAISDAHAGLKQAIQDVFVGASWQRCRIHFLRNVLALVPKSEQAARRQLRQVCTTCGARFPKVAILIDEAAAEILSFYAFPQAHWRQIYSTNP
jgi:putative transposase